MADTLRGPEEILQRRIGFKHAAVGSGDNDLLLRRMHLPQHMFELILRNQNAQSPKLHDDVGDAFADEPGRSQFGDGPRVGRAFDDLMPLSEGATRRKLGRIVIIRRRLERISSPGDRANALLAEPDQHFVGIG